MRTYLADTALLPQGWACDVLIEVEPSGNIAGVAADAKSGQAEPIHGIVLPGMIDLHSHAFQRALAGLTQRLGADAASFWTWRDTMYASPRRSRRTTSGPSRRQLYVELIKGGYTSVVEFHYLHHAPDGRRYAEPAAMSVALHEAALETGIALTLLPVVYMQAGVDGSPLAEAQRRFALDPDGWVQLAGNVKRSSPTIRTGASGWRCTRSERSRSRRSAQPWRRFASSPAICRSTSIWRSSRRRCGTVSSGWAVGRCACSPRLPTSTIAGAWCTART